MVLKDPKRTASRRRSVLARFIYHEGHVWKLLRAGGNGRCKARERNEEAIPLGPPLKNRAARSSIDESGLARSHILGAARADARTAVLQLEEALGGGRNHFPQLLFPSLYAIRGPEVIRHIQRPLLIVWDRLPAHRSALVREFIALSQGHIETEYLPGYAPELNPVEYIWAYWKQHELPNVCPNDYWELDERARTTLRRMRRKRRLIAAFWKQSSLSFD